MFDGAGRDLPLDVDVDGATRTGGIAIRSEMRNVEAYITHNGDLDFFSIHGVVYPLGDIQMVCTRPLRMRGLEGEARAQIARRHQPV